MMTPRTTHIDQRTTPTLEVEEGGSSRFSALLPFLPPEKDVLTDLYDPQSQRISSVEC